MGPPDARIPSISPITNSFSCNLMRIFHHNLLSTSAKRATQRFVFAVPVKEPKMPELWVEISNKLRALDEQRRVASERSWEINASLVRLEMAHVKSIKSSEEANDLEVEEENLRKLVKDTLSSNFYNNIVRDSDRDRDIDVEGDVKPHPRAPRLDTISSRLEDYARYKSFRHFLDRGSLISPSAFSVLDADHVERSVITDEEYLGGACIGLCHDLASYGITRASNAGIDPVAILDIQKARNVVSQIFEELLQFDFRNGPLRRKYDGTKYALKALETILYELSVAHALANPKKAKLDSAEGDPTILDTGIIPKDEIAAIRVRMDHRDQLRERLIKTCRDGQKAAKQAIFALHRGDTDRALKLLRECEQCVTNNLMPILHEEPELRGGCFSGVLEEYVEAYLFHSWLDNDDKETTNEPSGKIIDMASLPLLVSPEEYLGGLCDLSGEIGRYAVSRGTARDKKGVQLCLETNKMIYNSLRMAGKLPGSITKKKNALKIGVEKLERMIYELNLMEMTGRNEYATALENNSEMCDD
ncbi:hypothetical protein ACHAW6_011757 [Cyclotella cf. meneghiniana]